MTRATATCLKIKYLPVEKQQITQNTQHIPEYLASFGVLIFMFPAFPPGWKGIIVLIKTHS